jgi:hypothetical protein
MFARRGITTYTDFAQKTRHIGDVFSQKGVESDHVSFFPKENIVRQILNDLRDHLEPTPDCHIEVFWQFHIYSLWRNNSWRDKATSFC